MLNSVRSTSSHLQKRLFRKVNIADLEVLGVALQLRFTQENAQNTGILRTGLSHSRAVTWRLEKIYIEFKHGGDALKSVKCGLDVLGSDNSEQRCENFLERFYEEIHRDDALYRAVNYLKELLSEYIYNNKERKMLVVLGQPGIGKSTLITWITANFEDRADDIFVYKFASDMGNMDWQNIGEKRIMLYEILCVLGVSYNELCGKVLILDGFDEINVGMNRGKLINRLYWELQKENLIDKFSLIITCRENYIENIVKIKSDYITLQSWDTKQIRNFCMVYGKKTNRSLTEDSMQILFKGKEVFGIPLILYMILALDISIEKEDSIVDIYDQIFSLEGGIYERCITSISYEMPHRINEIKEQILRLLLPVTDRKYVMEGMILHRLSDYIRLGQWGNYSKLFLVASDLRGMKLHEQKLEMVCLRKADLRRCDLTGTNLCKADLEEADLRGAEVR